MGVNPTAREAKVQRATEAKAARGGLRAGDAGNHAGAGLGQGQAGVVRGDCGVAPQGHLEAGVIEPDHLADLIVLPRDPFSLNAADLMNLVVDITIVGGRVVYERGRPAIASSDSADLRST